MALGLFEMLQIERGSDLEESLLQWVEAREQNELFRGYPNREFERGVKRTTKKLDAYVNHDRWVADCECRAGVAVEPTLDVCVCLDCGTLYRVRMPDDWKAGEQVLAHRDVENRNWTVGQTVQDLKAENLTHGVRF